MEAELAAVGVPETTGAVVLWDVAGFEGGCGGLVFTW
jgi:hypothetical protein